MFKLMLLKQCGRDTMQWWSEAEVGIRLLSEMIKEAFTED